MDRDQVADQRIRRGSILQPSDGVTAYLADDHPTDAPAVGRKGDWIQTVSGRQYWPLDPRPEEIEIGDVAHALGMLCRFTGHCLRFYSVAEHSVHVFAVVRAHFQRMDDTYEADKYRRQERTALLHDGPEFALNDIARPVKRSITGYADIEEDNWVAFADRFNLTMGPTVGEIIKLADSAVLLAEQAALMVAPPAPWAPIIVPAPMLADAHAALAAAGSGWGPNRAKWEFLQAYEAVK